MSLIAIATTVGAPIIRDLLARKIGGQNTVFVERIVGAVAERLNVEPAAVDALAETAPDKVAVAVKEIEAEAPALLAVWMEEAQFAREALAAEQGEPLWMRAWRPGGMYLIGFLWLWNAVLLHSANAIWKVALPPMPFEQLIQLSGLYFTLYMGGHTVKDVIAKWSAKGGAA